MKGSHILIVEDDIELLNNLREHFEREGFLCRTATDGDEALERAQSDGYALIILDILLPKRSGTEVLTELRRRNNPVPVIFLTAKAEDFEKIVGLELGADDYVTKPFHLGELSARVKAVLRRTQHSESSLVQGKNTHLAFGPLSIDTRTRKVTANGKQVRLTALEYDLLLYLAMNIGVPQSREQILQQVWQTTFLGYEDSVNTAVKRLRQKIEEEPSNPKYIHTLRNVGYLFKVDRE